MKLTEIKPLDHLIADSGFTCLKAGEVVAVRENDEGKYVPCDHGKHYLDGQLNERGHIVGFKSERVSP